MVMGITVGTRAGVADEQGMQVRTIAGVNWGACDSEAETDRMEMGASSFKGFAWLQHTHFCMHAILRYT